MKFRTLSTRDSRAHTRSAAVVAWLRRAVPTHFYARPNSDDSLGTAHRQTDPENRNLVNFCRVGMILVSYRCRSRVDLLHKTSHARCSFVELFCVRVMTPTTSQTRNGALLSCHLARATAPHLCWTTRHGFCRRGGVL